MPGRVRIERVSSLIRVREARLDDVASIVALVESAYRGAPSRAGWTTEADLLDGRRTDEADVTANLTAADSLMLLAVDEAQEELLVGCCHLKRAAPETAYFGMFAVAPTRQAAGIGRLLLDAAEALAVSRWSATAMEMTVLGQRTDLIAWYQRRGYQPTGATTGWPHRSKTFGRPRRDDLYFATLSKPLG
jgi:ribosomal protein S18 acetylase RimI-like enzyme